MMICWRRATTTKKSRRKKTKTKMKRMRVKKSEKAPGSGKRLSVILDLSHSPQSGKDL